MTRILFAEDNKDLRVMTVCFLETEGFEVVAVDDGNAVLRELENSHFDLVLLDAAMPAITGIEAAAAIREHDYTLPVLLYTAYSEPMMHAIAKKYDAQILGKEKPPHDLLAAINQLIAGSKI